MKNIFKIVADDGAEEVVSAKEIGLKKDFYYTEEEVIKAACAAKNWSEKQICAVY